MEALGDTATWILAFALLLLGYTYVGYPILAHLLARFQPRPSDKSPHEPTVSLIIAAFNEEKAILEKLENTLAMDYPADKLEIVVASDGSTDRTHEIVEGFGHRVRLFVPVRSNDRGGLFNLAV